MSRQLAPFLEQEMGVPVNVINATGGAGVTGHSRGANARPDGHTLTMMTVELNMLRWRELTDISWTDFEVIGRINSDAAALFVRNEDYTRWSDPPALLEYVKDNRGQLRASGTANGGIWHLAFAGWLEDSGLSPADAKWIPMNGSGPSLQELVSGGVDVVCCSLPEARTLLEAGELKCIGVMSPERVAEHPTVPTFNEFGIAWTSPAWRGLGLPRGTPQPIVDRYSQTLEKILLGKTVLEGSKFPDLVRQQGFDVTWETAEPFKVRLRTLDEQLGGLLTGTAFSEVKAGPIQPFEIPLLFGIILAASILGIMIKEGKQAWLSVSSLFSVRVIETIGVVFFYLLTAESLGFIVSGIAILLYMLIRGGTSLKTATLITVVLVPLLYHLFSVLLRVPLPQGVFGW